jgi:hypothetical protein
VDCFAFFVFNFSPTALNFPLLNFAFKVREMRRVAQSPAGLVVVTVVTALAVILHRSGSTEPSSIGRRRKLLPSEREYRVPAKRQEKTSLPGRWSSSDFSEVSEV